MTALAPSEQMNAEWTVAAHEQGLGLRMVPIQAPVFDPRTELKCRYSCSAWGRRWTCEPGGWGAHQLIPLALAVAVTPRCTCDECTFPGSECRNRGDLRPESALAGIDSLATLVGLGIETEDGGAWLRVSYIFLA